MPVSKVKQMADEEAARAEAETPDEPEPGEPQPQPQPVPQSDEEEAAEEEEAPPEEPLSTEAFVAALEREAKRHTDALAAIFRADWERFEECPLCHLLGVVSPEDPVLDPTTQKCARCRGHGQLVTESAEPKHILRQCPDCNGNGYVPRLEVPAPTPPAPAWTPPPVPVQNPITGQWELPQDNGSPTYVYPTTPAAS